jgi:hypothetical protein
LFGILYSAQILLFGAEFTGLANTYGSHVEPEKHAERKEIELPREEERQRARAMLWPSA